MVSSYLLNQDKSCVVVVIVVGLVKVFIESKAGRARHIVSVCIEPEVGRRFAFSHILVVGALDAVAQVDTILALAIELVPYFELFSCAVASKLVGRGDLSATFVSGCGQTWPTALQFRRFFWDYLLSS